MAGNVFGAAGNVFGLRCVSGWDRAEAHILCGAGGQRTCGGPHPRHKAQLVDRRRACGIVQLPGRKPNGLRFRWRGRGRLAPILSPQHCRKSWFWSGSFLVPGCNAVNCSPLPRFRRWKTCESAGLMVCAAQHAAGHEQTLIPAQYPPLTPPPARPPARRRRRVLFIHSEATGCVPSTAPP